MVYKKYKYGCDKKKVMKLLNKRLDLKKKLRYYENMINKVNDQIKGINEEVDKYL